MKPIEKKMQKKDRQSGQNMHTMTKESTKK